MIRMAAIPHLQIFKDMLFLIIVLPPLYKLNPNLHCYKEFMMFLLCFSNIHFYLFISFILFSIFLELFLIFIVFVLLFLFYLINIFVKSVLAISLSLYAVLKSVAIILTLSNSIAGFALTVEFTGI